jgi:hypothetical protein
MISEQEEKHIRRASETILWAIEQIQWLRTTFSQDESNIEKELKGAREQLGIVLRGEIKEE